MYVKDETNFGPDRDAGLDAIAYLVDWRVCVAITYASSGPTRRETTSGAELIESLGGPAARAQRVVRADETSALTDMLSSGC
jgi:hypothetical protein